MELMQQNLVLNRPIYVGFSILEMSKVLINDFHHNHIKCRYGRKAELLFTDTGSLYYNIFTEELYNDMEQNKDKFDFSEYSSDHYLHDTTNKKVLGRMKDEITSLPISEFVGLRPKMYG